MTKKECKAYRTLSREELSNRIAEIPLLRDQAFIACLYLFGSRISELCKKVVIGQIVPDLTDPDFVIAEELIVLKGRKNKIRKRSIPINIKKDMLFFKYGGLVINT